MPLTIDPLLTLQLLAAVLIVLTMPESNEPRQAETASRPEQRKPFQLADGNTNVEHAGMAVNVDRIRNLSGAL